MKLVIFGLTITSSWGNGHATLWRGLVRALGARGHRVVFFERDVPYYAMHRDLTAIAGHHIQLYDSWDAVRDVAARHVRDADVAMVTSVLPRRRGRERSRARVGGSRSRLLRSGYAGNAQPRWRTGAHVEYLPPQGLGALRSGPQLHGRGALTALRDRLGARLVRPLYGSVDPDVHRPTASRPAFDADLSYLGTYAEDRQAPLTALCSSSRRGSARICGSSSAARCIPESFTWTPNIYYVSHVPPARPSRLLQFLAPDAERDARGDGRDGPLPVRPVVRGRGVRRADPEDWWEGLDAFFEPGREIFVADDDRAGARRRSACDDETRRRVARAARERTLDAHTAEQRVPSISNERSRTRSPVRNAPDMTGAPN